MSCVRLVNVLMVVALCEVELYDWSSSLSAKCITYSTNYKQWLSLTHSIRLCCGKYVLSFPAILYEKLLSESVVIVEGEKLLAILLCGENISSRKSYILNGDLVDSSISREQADRNQFAVFSSKRRKLRFFNWLRRGSFLSHNRFQIHLVACLYVVLCD